MTDVQRGSEYVRENGELGGAHVSYRETIYVNVLGNNVERFQGGGRSFIYKPLAFAQTKDREIWAQDTIAPLLSSIRVPCIHAASETFKQGIDWLIYEDLGPLQHCTTSLGIIEAAGWIKEWHRLPVSLVPSEFAGHTPHVADIVQQVLPEADYLPERIDNPQMDAIAEWIKLVIARGPAIFNELPVVSHGDYHPYNVAVRQDERIVLDWEFVHLNHRYWDLYSLLDITSYRYEKPMLLRDERAAALNVYWDNQQEVSSSKEHFTQGYYLYASLYSAWIAGLIENDRKREELPQDKLLRQRRETSAVFNDCLRELII